MNYVVCVTEYPVNKSTSWTFSKLKDAVSHLKAIKKIFPNAYFCLYFDKR